MAKTSITPTENTPAATEAELVKIGRQIEGLYEETTQGLVKCVALGDLVRQFRGVVSTVDTTTRKASHGPQMKGEGIKAELAKYAPNVPRSTAYRFEDLAEAVRDELKVGVKVSLHDVLLGNKPDEKALKLRAKVVEFVAGKSQRQILLEVGKYQAQIGGARTTANKLTPEQERAEWIAAARSRATTALNELHTLGDRWKLLTDDLVEQAAKDAETAAKQMREWLKTPAAQRAELDLALLKGEDAADVSAKA